MAQVNMVKAVHRSADGDVLRVRWGKVDTDRNAWQGDDAPSVANVIEVVDLLMTGTDVWTVMPSGQPGPKLRVVAANGGHGIETVELDDETRTVADLEQF